jgi:hypothetical protein
VRWGVALNGGFRFKKFEKRMKRIVDGRKKEGGWRQGNCTNHPRWWDAGGYRVWVKVWAGPEKVAGVRVCGRWKKDWACGVYALIIGEPEQMFNG